MGKKSIQHGRILGGIGRNISLDSYPAWDNGKWVWVKKSAIAPRGYFSVDGCDGMENSGNFTIEISGY